MNIEQLIADLRSRVNPQYYDQVGTESYERHQCVMALESLLARIDVLRIENEAMRDAMRKIMSDSYIKGTQDNFDALVESGVIKK